MAGVDLNVFRFDFDLTFAALLMNADGTIYHTYAGRDFTGHMSHTSMKSLVDVLHKTLEEHRSYARSPKPPKKRKKLTIEQLPKWKRRIDRGKPPECFHCHMVNEAIIDDLKKRKIWSLDKAWTWPDPIQAGLHLSRDDQAIVSGVRKGSAADKAGLGEGDRLTSLGGQRILTFGDVQRVLDETPLRGGGLPASWARGETAHTGTIKLTKGWKAATPLVFSWRSSKWPLSPKPGFGGQQLTAEQLRRQGLPEDSFAFKVGYIVDWGENAHTGRNAHGAGIRNGDIIVSLGGRSDFKNMHHYHAWVRLKRKVGDTVGIELIRRGKRMKVELKLVG
jgi:predicted metalloprotease with PDZ domain